MTRTATMALIIGLAVLSTGTHADTVAPTRWPYGFWVGVLDEDNGPLDFFEIRPDDTIVFWGFCRDGRASGGEATRFHWHAGDIYVTSEIPGKGPIALVFRLNKAKKQITYTSPSTRNNQFYEYRAKSPCPTA